MWSSYFYNGKDRRIKKEICQGPRCLKMGFVEVLAPDKLMSAEQSANIHFYKVGNSVFYFTLHNDLSLLKNQIPTEKALCSSLSSLG